MSRSKKRRKRGGRWHLSSYDRRKVRARMIQVYGLECIYCGIELTEESEPARPNSLTLDHVIPAADGGSNRMLNFVPACPGCNNQRSTKEFMAFWFTKKEVR